MRNLNYILIVVAFVLLLTVGCTTTEETKNETEIPEVIVNDTIDNNETDINNDTITDEINESSLIEANNKFALDMYNHYTGEENLFLSPYSISTAIGMLYEGAEGQTKTEIGNVFYYPENTKEQADDLYLDLNSNTDNYNLSTANALWLQQNFEVKQNYIDNIKNYYHGQIEKLDFIKDTENSRITINDWVENETNNKIQNLIPEGSLNEMTRAVLTNAIYFKSEWHKQFNNASTYEDGFTLTNGQDITTEFMRQKDSFQYTEDDNYQVLKMDYKGRDLSMLVILPKENEMNEISYNQIKNWRQNLKGEEVIVKLPKFKIEDKYFMKKDLSNMGMSTAFSGKANLNRIANNLTVDEVIHQTFIEVDEAGTEAAAATAVIIELTSVGEEMNPPEPKLFEADHPFTFIIQDNDTGTILFMGRLDNPQ